MKESVPPPAGFDEPFFRWLDGMSEALSVQFASPGVVPGPDLRRLEQQAGGCLPLDLLQFYARYNPWGALRNWSGWEVTKQAVAERIGKAAPLLPIDCRSYSSHGWDTVVAVSGPERYEVIERWRATGAVRRYPDLRSYFIAGVVEEIVNDPESGLTLRWS
jgi:hypothetical protein